MFVHKISKGYMDPVGRVVKEVNGVPIKNPRCLVETIRDCHDEYLTFRCAEDWSDVLVFDRKEMDKATEEILDENGIAPTRLGGPDKGLEGREIDAWERWARRGTAVWLAAMGYGGWT